MSDVPANSADPGPTSMGFLQGIQEDQRDAWVRLVDLYGPLVYKWCRHLRVAPDDVPDVVQDVFEAVAAHIEQFQRQASGQGFRRWLWTITHNKAMDHFRRYLLQARGCGGTDAQIRLAEIAVDSSDDSVHPPADDRIFLARRAIELVRAEFSDRLWQAFWRTAVDAQRGKAVAAELGMTTCAVYQAKHRILRRIRDLLGTDPIFRVEPENHPGPT